MESATKRYSHIMTHTIIIVEDNEINMMLFNDLLQSRGYETLQSFDGMDILDLARKHQPDLIIMDIQLPVKSGLEHTKALKADDELKDIPVLVVTAFTMQGDKERMIEFGCNGYLYKPISVPLFLESVAQHISRPESIVPHKYSHT